MPYKRVGAMKVSDHWVRSPRLNVARACQVCHPYTEAEIAGRVEAIQSRTHALLERSASALTDLLDATAAAKKNGATAAQLAPIAALQRKAQWRVDFVAAENSMTAVSMRASPAATPRRAAISSSATRCPNP